MRLALISAIALLCLLAAACSRTPDDVREANQAALSGETSSSPRPNDFGAIYGPIATFDLRPGDCFDAEAPASEVGQVLRVPCEGFHTHRVLANVYIGEEGGWPGDDFLQAEAVLRCDITTESVIYPSADSWFIGDRTMLCLEDN